MGCLADAVLVRVVERSGVMPQALVDLEVAHQGLTEFRIVRWTEGADDEMADACLILPGAY
jgi:hypothetical protein